MTEIYDQVRELAIRQFGRFIPAEQIHRNFVVGANFGCYPVSWFARPEDYFFWHQIVENFCIDYYQLNNLLSWAQDVNMVAGRRRGIRIGDLINYLENFE